ncbi:MAG: hypothetical protein KBT22_10765 [Bacteroidales bacterium]|nr:hypothetical protein [Candidatus Scybalocola fimicaballi]
MDKFLKNFCLFCLPILGIAIFTIYCTVTFPKDGQGDLGRFGYVYFDEDYNRSLRSFAATDTSKIKNIQSLDEVDADSSILTVGDSFSQMGDEGYQAFLQDLYPGYTIFNFVGKDVSIERFQWAVDILKDTTVKLPEIIIIESVERSLSHRLYDIVVSSDGVGENAVRRLEPKNDSEQPEMNNGSVADSNNNPSCLGEAKKVLANTQEYIRKKLNIENPVKRVGLNDSFFTCKGHENELVYYKFDLRKMSPTKAPVCQQKMDSILSLASKRDIRFLFVVASDKFHLYNEFTVNNSKRNAVSQLSYFEKVYDSPMFLNTRLILSEHLKNREKDIYKSNDTHWSAKASKYVAEEIKKKLESQK